MPKRYLERRGFKTYYNRPEAADIIYLSRVSGVSFLRLIEREKQRGAKIVYEMDDNFWLIEPTSPHIKDKTPSTNRGREDIIALCDAVVVTTEPLAHVVESKTGKKAWVIPNFLDPETFVGATRLSEIEIEPNPVLLISGSDSHYGDFELLRDVSRHPSLAGFRWAVYASSKFLPVFNNPLWIRPTSLQGYFANLLALGRNPNIMGVVPLARCPFNESKSRLKWLEYTHAGIPGLYSASAEYPECASALAPTRACCKEWVEVILSAFSRRQEILKKDQARLAEIGHIDTGVDLWQECFLAVARG